MSRKALFSLIFFIAGLLGGQVWGQEFSTYGNPLTRLTVKDIPVVAEVVSTPQKCYMGLSHRQKLPEGQGMLFVLGAARRYAFCMRDMLISIDIIWIADGKVAGLHKQLSPSDAGDFIAPVPVRLVLEVPGGFADRHGIKVGDPVVFQRGGL
ncbi:MAG: DUF192 domain-containing protein [Syntrophobacterales bacterium]|jgi:uncharacterized membrane protein (UPF0127 family)